MAFTLSSPSFENGGRIPARFTCEGDDISPHLRWSGAPEGTESFALLCDDPDAPAGTWHHWAVYDIPPDMTELPENCPKTARVDGALQAINDFGRPGYGGPCPPPGHGTHRYYFRLLALDVATLELADAPECAAVADVAGPHVLAETELVGTYAR